MWQSAPWLHFRQSHDDCPEHREGTGAKQGNGVHFLVNLAAPGQNDSSLIPGPELRKYEDATYAERSAHSSW